MSDEDKPIFQIYTKDTFAIVRIVGVVTAIAAAITIVAIGILLQCDKPKLLIALALVWSVIPPIWFWYEFYFLYRNNGNLEEFDKFKYGQELSKAIWLGLGAALFAAVAFKF